jgi:hypothetical protein
VAVERGSIIYLDQQGEMGVGPPALISVSSKGAVRILWIAASIEYRVSSIKET